MVKSKKVLVLKNEVLLEIRKTLGLSQVKMAELCNVSSPTYQYWELGVNNPSEDSIDKLALLLKDNESLLKENNLPFKVDDLFAVRTVEKEEEENPYLFLGFKLKKLRQDENLKQEDFAKLIVDEEKVNRKSKKRKYKNIFVSTISKWERGASFCRFKYGKQIAKVFEIENFMELYVLREDVYSLILENEIPARYAKDFVKEGLVLDNDVQKLQWDEEGLRKLADFKLLKLYRYYIKYDV